MKVSVNWHFLRKLESLGLIAKIQLWCFPDLICIEKITVA